MYRYVDYKTRKLSNHPAAQCRVRLYDNGDICFQSYHTDVLYYDSLFKRLYCSGTYSQTTAKQITWFLREYFPNLSYHDCKAAYQQQCRINTDVVTRLSLTPLTDNELDLMRRAHYESSSVLYPASIKEAQ